MDRIKDEVNQIYKDFQNKSFNMDKLSISYWNSKIREHFKCLQG